MLFAVRALRRHDDLAVVHHSSPPLPVVPLVVVVVVFEPVSVNKERNLTMIFVLVAGGAAVGIIFLAIWERRNLLFDFHKE
jgi:thiol:disulfide interchange protein